MDAIHWALTALAILLTALVIVGIVILAILLKTLTAAQNYLRQPIKRYETDFGEFVRYLTPTGMPVFWIGKAEIEGHAVTLKVPGTVNTPDADCLGELPRILERLSYLTEIARQDEGTWISEDHSVSLIDLCESQEARNGAFGDDPLFVKLGFKRNLSETEEETVYLTFVGEQIVGDFEVSTTHETGGSLLPFAFITPQPKSYRGRN